MLSQLSYKSHMTAVVCGFGPLGNLPTRLFSTINLLDLIWYTLQSTVNGGKRLWKRHQRSKQSCQDLCWKVHDCAQSFVFFELIHHEWIEWPRRFHQSVPFFSSKKKQLCFVLSRSKKRIKAYNNKLSKQEKLIKQCLLLRVARMAIERDLKTIALAPNKDLLIHEG